MTLNITQITSLKSLVYKQIKTAINDSETSLKRAKNSLEIIYQSPIAFKLAGNNTPLNIAHQLAKKLSTNNESLISTVNVIPPGWIEFHLSHQTIATWLQSLILLDFPTVEALGPAPFALQYAHARCCSLLQTGQRQELIDLHPITLKILQPFPIPWLNSTGTLQFSTSPELALISSLVNATDDIATHPNFHPLKLTSEINDKFETFHRHCRLWGEVAQQTPQLTQARLGLISATQITLKFFLEHFLSVSAPFHL